VQAEAEMANLDFDEILGDAQMCGGNAINYIAM
jgi:hypothetical protein